MCLLLGWRIYIWNPYLGDALTLNAASLSGQISFYWFGRDRDTANQAAAKYKLVAGVNNAGWDGDGTRRIYVFSSDESDGLYGWRKTKETTLVTKVFEERGTLLNGIVHWPAYDHRAGLIADSIVSYDLSSDKIGRIRGIPVVWDNFTLGVYDGFLCAICKPENNKLEVWMMKEYGVGQSWTKMMTLDGFEVDSQVLRPLGFLKHGELLVDVDGKKLVRYTIDSQKTNVVKAHDNEELCDAIAFVRNFILPTKIIQLRPSFIWTAFQNTLSCLLM